MQMWEAKLTEAGLASDRGDPQMLSHPERRCQGCRQSPSHVPSSLLLWRPGHCWERGRGPLPVCMAEVWVACPGCPEGPPASAGKSPRKARTPDVGRLRPFLGRECNGIRGPDGTRMRIWGPWVDT